MSRWKYFLIVFVIMAWQIPLGAQAPQAAPVVAVRAGRLFDTQTGKLLSNQVVLIRGDRIEEVGPAGQVKIPAGAKVIDLSHETVLPGLVDAHDHLFDVLPPAERIDTTREAWTLLAMHEAETDLRAGYTTIREMCTHGEGYGDVAVKKAVISGLFEGPRMQITTLGIGAGPDYIGAPGSRILAGHQNVTGVDAVREAVRAQIHYGADWIELFEDGFHTFSPSGQLWVRPSLTLAEAQAAVDEAHREHVKVSCDAYGDPGLKICVDAGVDSIEHGQDISDAEMTTMLQKGIYWDTTLYRYCMPGAVDHDHAISDGKYSTCALSKNTLRRALARGLKIAFGSGADGNPLLHGTQVVQFEALVKAGMTPLQAILASVKTDPEMMGWQNEIGSIQKGYFADIIAVSGNPLQNIADLGHVQFVMKGGQVIKNDLK